MVPIRIGWPFSLRSLISLTSAFHLPRLRLVDLVVRVVADHRAVGRDLDHRHLVDLHELLGLGQRRARHAGELLVEAEVVLERDRRERLVLLADADALLGLDRLVEALGPAAPFEDAAGELVDDHHLAVDHRVVGVLVVELLGLEALDQVVDQRAVLRRVEVLDAEELLGLVDAGLGGGDGLVLLVVLEVVLGLGGVARLAEGLQLRHGLLADHLLGEAGEGAVGVGRLLGAAGDDERRPRLVDQDVVDLVDDAEDVVALDALLERGGHVVAQVVEAELGVGAVGDARRVHLAALGRRHHRLDHADVHAERVEDGSHPCGVAASQVVVHGDDVDRARRRAS